MLIREKVAQAVKILDEFDCDCWITFVRESSSLRDPMLVYLAASDVTWHSAFIITRKGEKLAILGQMDKQSVEDLGVYSRVTGYVQGIKQPLLEALKELNPRKIALNFSLGSEVCDGLTHGMYLTLHSYLSEIGFQDRVVSSEKIASSLKARKTPAEIDRLRKAVGAALEIFCGVTAFIAPGKTEREIADFMIQEVERRSLGFAWDPTHCPAVFTGPDTAEAHYKPTDRKVERGHVLNIDFGVKWEEYCSDLQRTFYILEEGETAAPAEVQKGFDTIVESIRLSAAALRPGVQGIAVDEIARRHIVSRGYEEYPHALGHQVGRFAHDGTALLGPAWEKYANKPFEPIEERMVFTLEPRLKIPRRGVATVEEMVLVTSAGAEFLGPPQREIILIR
jgi:Xaa-Pro aminopeptidase